MTDSWLPPKWDRHRPTIRQLSGLAVVLESALARIEWETAPVNGRLRWADYQSVNAELAALRDDLPAAAGGKGHADGDRL
jgi:hypothetical protein